MEYDAGKTKPEPNRTFLVQQVNEQSNVCDVTVKMGVWEKKFHRCVLAISPFFGHVLNDNFLEGQTGIIEIKIGTPVTLETTIMYLYGKKPKFNDENIENIVQMAEFLLIPNLKSACIAWLTTISITRENCMKFLQLSSIFDFELPSCTTYIEEHLPELLHLPEMVNLTEDSMLLLFSDKRLSCVPMDDRLLFLFRWLDANPGLRKAHIKELLKDIDLHSISNQCLQACLQNPDVACHIQSEHMTPAESNDHRVLIIKDVNYNYVFWCLDLERDQWFRVKSNSLKEERSNRIVDISGTCTNIAGSIVCSIRRSCQKKSFVLLDLPNDACTKMNLIGSEEEGLSIEMPDNVKFDGNVCIVSENKEIEIERKQNPKKRSGLSDIHHKFRHMSTMGLTSERQSRALQMREKIRRRRTFENIIISTLYIGHIGESNVVMSPLFSFIDDTILKFAISDNAIAIIFQSRQFVAMYDLIDGHLERESQWTSDSDEIAPIKDGFVIYDNKRCITFIRMQGECLSQIPGRRNSIRTYYMFQKLNISYAVRCYFDIIRQTTEKIIY
ncbi:uncharacterized protein LOC132716322 isoform X2 [Ruditapes philippinarum]|nr:uncharacterized protein LOC132716322 isoform X2 [Ruditapes philippinarum]